jgi:hypothetical protein
MFAAAGTVANTNTLHGSSGISGFYIEGTGNYQYAGDYFNGTNSAIDPLVTQTVYKWKPYATDGTTLTAIRGTSSFDSTQFTVTDGFVQFTGVPLTWVDRAVSATVVSNQGNFIPVAGVQLTLPAVPAQGDVCLFKDIGGNPFDILANAGQTMQFGSTTGTIATNTLIGDAVDLTYYAAGSAWVANSIVGIWNVT